MQVITLILVLAFVVEGITEKVHEQYPKIAKWLLWGISWVIGLVLAFGLGLDILVALGFTDLNVVWSWVPMAITGTAIGAGSNFINRIIEFIKNRTP